MIILPFVLSLDTSLSVPYVRKNRIKSKFYFTA